MKENEPKTYVNLYVPISQAKRLKDLEQDGINNFVEEYIAETKRDMKVSIENMDEDIIQYKAFMIDARKKFRAAKEEMLEANWALWDEFEEQQKFIYNKAQKAADQLKPLTEELQKITKLMNVIDNYKIESFLEILEKIKDHLYGEDRKILEFLTLNYKRPL